MSTLTSTPPSEPPRPRSRFASLFAAVWEYLPPALLLVGLVGLWELLVHVLGTRPYMLPAPSRIWRAFLEVRHLLPGHLRTTLSEALLGLWFAAGIGVALAVVIAAVPLVRRVLYPLLVVSQTLPMVVLAPLLIVWFGFGMTPKIVVVALVRSMGATRLQELRHVLIPSALPAFFAGLKIAATYAVLAAVIGEWVGASSGLGIFITRSQTAFRVDRVFVAVVVVAITSIALFLAVQLLARFATPWMYVHEEEIE